MIKSTNKNDLHENSPLAEFNQGIGQFVRNVSNKFGLDLEASNDELGKRTLAFGGISALFFLLAKGSNVKVRTKDIINDFGLIWLRQKGSHTMYRTPPDSNGKSITINLQTFMHKHWIEKELKKLGLSSRDERQRYIH